MVLRREVANGRQNSTSIVEGDHLNTAMGETITLSHINAYQTTQTVFDKT